MSSYLEELSKRLEAATSGMNDDTLMRAPEGKWCAAEVLEHLRLTYTGTSKMLERNRDKAVVEPAPTDERTQAARQLIFEKGGFFQGLKAPEFATPKPPCSPQVKVRVMEDLRRLAEILDEAEQRRGKDANLGNHFALGPLTAEQWRRFHYEHGCHHAKQIEALKQWAARASA
jgi:DinB superfamily